MDETAYKIILAGQHGVGKSTIFNELKNQADGYGMGMQTVDVDVGTGTMSGYSGKSGKSGRENWMVRVRMHSSGRDVTVMKIPLTERDVYCSYDLRQVLQTRVAYPDLVSCPDPLAHAKRVWCSEQHFLSHGAGPISDLRSPIRLQKT